jgi:prepilin-type N-terminal cleavage/methylation domain-containing protein
VVVWRPASGFTLMELLVVIAIMALLMGIIVPSYFSIREKAKYTKAKVTVKNLETAFKAYLDHYRVWPLAFGGGAAKEIDENIVKILWGENVGDANSAKIPFYEFETTNAALAALDPFTDSTTPPVPMYYRVQVDHDYNNQITWDGQTLYRSVIVWSPGADRTNYTADDVKSWD